MTYPLLRINVAKIRENAGKIVSECALRGVSVWGVSKGFSAMPEIVNAYWDAGIRGIADSRILNIKNMRRRCTGRLEYILIRIPMLSEIEDVVKYCDVSLASDMSAISALSGACARRRKEHRCIIMFDMGDLREGFLESEIEEVAMGLAKVSPYLKIYGVGANFSCASGVLPSAKNLTELLKRKAALESALGYKLEICSGGGSCSFLRMLDGEMPEGVNNLRIGEALPLGRDTAFNRDVDFLRQDALTVEAEIIEVRRKPSLPIGEIGRDAFGNIRAFEDRGERLRAILAIGRQDVCVEGLRPLADGVCIVAASSDHLVADIEDCPVKHRVGDALKFIPDYAAMLSSSTSPYVERVFEYEY